MAVVFASIHVGTPVLPAPWPIEMTAKIGVKTSSIVWKIDFFPWKNRRTLQVLYATLSAHGRTANGLGKTTERPTMGETRRR